MTVSSITTNEATYLTVTAVGDPTEMGLIESCIEWWNSTTLSTCYMTHLDLIKNPRRVFLIGAQGPACQLETLHLGDTLEAVGI